MFFNSKKIKQELKGKIPLMAFLVLLSLLQCMIEGRGRSGFMLRNLFFILIHQKLKLLQILTENIINYLDFQVRYGADVLMIFDT